ncbi:MAG TPA: hypothetical protein VFV93_18965 [Thermomicrobiales bacterium]|nr:hypothetical protein [Thermomicrobiales bacterium]
MCCLVAILAGVAWGIGWQSGSAASPKLAIDAPEEALAGEPIEIRLVIDDANGIAAFDATIGFDTSIASLQSFDQRANDLVDLGRDVKALGPVELPDGVAVGAYACPAESCADLAGKSRNTAQGTGSFRLAAFTIVGWQPGPLTIDLTTAQFTDGSGRPVEVDLSGATVTVEVMPNGEVQ